MRIALKELEQIIREELTQLLSERYTRSDIRNMTPQQAQRAAAQLSRDTGGNFNHEMMQLIIS